MNELKLTDIFDVTYTDANPDAMYRLYEDWKAYIDRADATITTYTKGVKAFMSWLTNNDVWNPDERDIIAFKNALLDDDYKPSTVNIYLTGIKQFFKWTAYKGYYKDIADRVSMVRIGDHFNKDILSEDASALLLQSVNTETVEGKRNHAMIGLMITTGIRTVEVSRARIKDLTLKHGEHVLYIKGKGETDYTRHVKVDPMIYEWLQDYLQNRPEWTVYDDAPLFLSVAKRTAKQVKPMTTRSISRVVKTAMQSAGMDSPRLTAHSLRHTAGTLNIKNGGSLEETAGMLGHSTTRITKRYTHGMERDMNDSEYRIASAIRNAMNK